MTHSPRALPLRLGPEPPTQENSPVPTASPARGGKNPRSFRRGRGEDESTCIGQNHLFSTAEALGSPPGLASAPLKALRPLHSAAGGPRVTMSQVHWAPRGRTDGRRPSARASPGPPEPPPGRRKGARRRTVPKGCGVAGSVGEGRTPLRRRLLARICPTGGRTRAPAGSRARAPGGWAEAPAGFDPPTRSSPRGAASATTSRHLSQLGWQRSPRTDPGRRQRAPSYSAPGCSKD